MAADAVGRPMTPDGLLRLPAPTHPVLLAGPAEHWEATGIVAWLDDHGWSSTPACDAPRARWLASIQRMSLVLVAGDDAAVWEMVEATRPVTMAPIVVLGSPPPPGVIALVGAGVDAVVDPASGADDIFARVTPLLRRSDNGWEPGVRYLVAGPLRVDLVAQHCDLDGRPLHLSPTEYSLLTFLMTHQLQALSAHVIVRRVWGWLPSDGRNALRIFVNRLRRKLGDDPRHPVYIASVRGTGYRFVRPVTEMGDAADRSDTADRSDATLLLASIEELAVTLGACATVDAAADALVGALDATGYADAMAVFRVDGDAMRLVAQRNLPGTWLSFVSDGVPLQPGFASAQSVLSRQPVQFADLELLDVNFPATAARLSGFHACLFIPIIAGGRVWGHLGLARRARQAFDPTGTSYLRAMCAVFALALSPRSRGHR